MLTDRPLVLYGAGGHAGVVLDAIMASHTDCSRLVVVDENPALSGTRFFGHSVVSAGAAEAFSACRFHVAIGRNDIRRAIAGRLCLGGGEMVTFVHPGASVARAAQVAAGAFLAAGCVVAPAAKVDDGVIVNHGAVVDHDCVIGPFAHIAPRATLGGGVRVGAGVLVGAGAVVLPGLSIGDGAVVGAGAVVVNDVPAGVTVVGVPARERRKE